MKLPFDQQFHFWVYTPKIPKYQYKKYMHPYVYSSAIYKSQDLETAYQEMSK